MKIQSKTMQQQWDNSYLEAENAAYLASLENDPLEAEHQAAIQDLIDLADVEATGWSPSELSNDVSQLINAFRAHGHRLANLDPLNLSQPVSHPTLSLDYFGLQNDAEAKSIFEKYKAIYSNHIGYEFAYIEDLAEVEWLENEIEKNNGAFNFSTEEKKSILTDLTTSEGLEKFLGRRYVGKTRFSIEGLDSLIPCMNEIIAQAANTKVDEVIIGMAHRGRLNVMVNVLGMKPAYLVDYMDSKLIDPHYAGDVVYHLGFSSKMSVDNHEMMLTMAFNPSHLEIISPVVMGAVKAKQNTHPDVLSVLLHGDAAFAGQGVVMESFAMSQTPGYSVGGSIHIATNNQVGFTTSNPNDARSSLYCTDIAKMINAPVFHVNADDPEAVVFVTRLAMRYREKFRKDVVIDLVGYRRYGHNEADEPSATQPVMYNNIRQHISTRALYAEKLTAEKILSAEDVDKIMSDYQNGLDAGDSLKSVSAKMVDYQAPEEWSGYLNNTWRAEYDSRITSEEFKTFAEKLLALPENFVLQTQVKRVMQAREKMASGEAGIDWGMAENLAYASLLAKGYPVRLSGEDVRRGTFAHRHAVFHHQESGETYMPLSFIAKDQAPIHVIDSLLSEEAVMAFEYGYTTSDSKTLTMWEAQYGDFVNGAQVVIDQFISSGEQKWKQLCGLILLLPHSFEGAGPEHSSARLERYLQLCAEENMQVCVPSTPAQIFHLLRRQMLRPYRKPLIVITPKSVLRHKLAVSTMTDFTEKKFQLVIADNEIQTPTRVILCAGKVYYDLVTVRTESNVTNVAIVRVEQLYPFPKEEVIAALSAYKDVKDFVWCQEEPQNQGAWMCIRDEISACLQDQQKLTLISRPASASPATGFAKVHAAEQAELMKRALYPLV
ncbi:MAG: 2-oxoglutarate dehydrogenase E1 component [Pseudomonadota bacterium]